jgi:hypothetical protein
MYAYINKLKKRKKVQYSRSEEWKGAFLKNSVGNVTHNRGRPKLFPLRYLNIVSMALTKSNR